MSYTIRYNRATNHIQGIGCRSTGGGKDMGDHVSYYAVSACAALTRSVSNMAVSKSFESLAEALDYARELSGRKLCKSCEKAAIAQLAAEAEEAEEAADPMATPEGQLAAARSRGLEIVTVKATGKKGWVIQSGGHALRVRIAGPGGQGSILRLSADDVELESETATCPTHPQASGREGDEKYHTDGRCQRLTVMSTDQLRKGDVVIQHGMRVLLEEEPRVYPKGDRTVYAFDGHVANLEEVKAAGHVPPGYLRTHKWADGQGWVLDREDVWVIQGNELARWTVER